MVGDRQVQRLLELGLQLVQVAGEELRGVLRRLGQAVHRIAEVEGIVGVGIAGHHPPELVFVEQLHVVFGERLEQARLPGQLPAIAGALLLVAQDGEIHAQRVEQLGGGAAVVLAARRRRRCNTRQTTARPPRASLRP